MTLTGSLPQRQIAYPICQVLGLVHLGKQFAISNALSNCDLELVCVNNTGKSHSLLFPVNEPQADVTRLQQRQLGLAIAVSLVRATG